MQCNSCHYVVAAANNVIAHPGQDVELICSLGLVDIGWLVDHMGPYGVSSLFNGVLDGYSADIGTNSIIILSITMNDSRNGTEYQCGIIRGGSFLEHESDPITLYVAGEFQ